MRKRTQKQIEAARANGSKSKGPVTQEGKERSSANALIHGAYSENILIHLEDDEQFKALLAAYTEHWQPSTRPEYDLVRDIAVARWRLDRNIAMETASLQLEIGRTEGYFRKQFENLEDIDFIAHAWSSLSDRSRTLTSLGRQENSLRRTIIRASAELRRLKAGRDNAKSCRNEPGGSQLVPNQSLAGKADLDAWPEAA